MLAEAVCGCFEAARTSWLAGPRDVPLHEQMSEALDIADRMTRPLPAPGACAPALGTDPPLTRACPLTYRA
jgi:hypothetical protein